MRLLRSILEPAVAALVFGIVEMCFIVGHYRLYRESLRRARRFGRFPFHAFPRSANEKFLWRKVFDRDPSFVRLSDKLALRGWLEETGLDLFMARVLWAGFSPHALPEAVLSGDIMIKANHDSGTHFPMWANPPSRDVLVASLERALAEDYSRRRGEWGYTLVVPRVFAEERIGREGMPINDLKFYTFGRRIERIVHIQDRETGRYGQVFEPDGKSGFHRLERAPAVCDGKLVEPLDGVFERAVDLARLLGGPFDQMRVDLLEADGDLFLTEMTIYNQSGHIADGGAYPGSQISRAWDIRRSWAIRTRPGGPATRLYLWFLKRALDRAAASRDLPPA